MWYKFDVYTAFVLLLYIVRSLYIRIHFLTKVLFSLFSLILHYYFQHFSPYDVLFTSCSLSHYKDKIHEQLATDPRVGHSYSTLSSVTLITTKPLLSTIYFPTFARTNETVSFHVGFVFLPFHITHSIAIYI